MPNTKSARKAYRRSTRRRVQNSAKKRFFKQEIKVFTKLVDAGKRDEAQAQLPKVYKSLDKAAKTNTIKRNRASRLKSRLSRRLAAPRL